MNFQIEANEVEIVVKEFSILIKNTHKIFFFFIEFLMRYLFYNNQSSLISYLEHYEFEKFENMKKIKKKSILKICKHFSNFFTNQHNEKILIFFRKFIGEDIIFEQIMSNDKIFTIFVENGCTKAQHVCFDSLLNVLQEKFSFSVAALFFEKTNKYLSLCEQNQKPIVKWKINIFFQLLYNLMHYFDEKIIKINRIIYYFDEKEEMSLLTLEMLIKEMSNSKQVGNKY